MLFFVWNVNKPNPNPVCACTYSTCNITYYYICTSNTSNWTLSIRNDVGIPFLTVYRYTVTNRAWYSSLPFKTSPEYQYTIVQNTGIPGNKICIPFIPGIHPWYIFAHFQSWYSSRTNFVNFIHPFFLLCVCKLSLLVLGSQGRSANWKY